MTPLRQRMLEDMQVRNLSPHTQRAYVETVALGSPPVFRRYSGLDTSFREVAALLTRKH